MNAIASAKGSGGLKIFSFVDIRKNERTVVSQKIIVESELFNMVFSQLKAALCSAMPVILA